MKKSLSCFTFLLSLLAAGLSSYAAPDTVTPEPSNSSQGRAAKATFSMF